MITDKLQFYKDCDIVLNEIKNNHSHTDSNLINKKLHFIDVFKSVIQNHEIEYIRAIHYELYVANGFLGGVNSGDEKIKFDQVFHLNHLTSKGFHFISTTSFVEQYLENQRTKELNENAIRSSIESAKSSKISADSSVSSKYASWASAVFAGLAIIFSVYQYLNSQEINNEFKALKKQVESLIQNQKEIQLHTKGLEALADSLKTLPKKK
ncbi:hypothetical protein [Emticicia aquatilis]|nr:hypothetical protein [Emticicia aquatilis]